MFARPVREVFRPARPDVGASAKKFALRAENPRILVILGLPGELFRGWAAGGSLLGEFFRGLVGEGLRWANYVAYTGAVATYRR